MFNIEIEFFLLSNDGYLLNFIDLWCNIETPPYLFSH